MLQATLCPAAQRPTFAPAGPAGPAVLLAQRQAVLGAVWSRCRLAPPSGHAYQPTDTPVWTKTPPAPTALKERLLTKGDHAAARRRLARQGGGVCAGWPSAPPRES